MRKKNYVRQSKLRLNTQNDGDKRYFPKVIHTQ